MAVHHTHKQSDTEKRLQLLSRQLYGKNEKLDLRGEKIESHNLSSNTQHPTSNQDITYLKHDLTKITILAGLAIGVQLILYYFVF